METFSNRIKPLITAAALAALLLTASAAHAQQQSADIAKQVIGAWSLVSQYLEKEGTRTERFGANPKGTVIFADNGRFAAILLRSDLPKIAAHNPLAGTADEYKAIAQGSTAYFGTWTIDPEGAILTHVEGSTFPNWDGQDQRRVTSLSGDELRFCVPSQMIGGVSCTVWRRLH